MAKKSFLLIVAIWFSVYATPALSQVGFDRQDFRNFIAKEMQIWNVPGAAVLVIKDGEVIFSEAFGHRDVEKGLKVTPETIFPIASCTKPFTSLAVGLLVDDGKISWDRPVRDYYPGLRMYDKYTTEHITPRDILCHRSGMPRHDQVWLYAGLPRNELMARLRYLQPSYGFREVFQYNNIVYTVAGVMVEKVTGMSYEEFVVNRIFAPLGMKNSNLSLEETQQFSNYALPYNLKPANPLQVVENPAKYPVVKIPFQPVYTTAPASSINSTLDDMGKWVMLHLNEGKLGGRQFLSKETMLQLHSPQMATSSVGEFKAFLGEETPMINYGLGWAIQPYRGHYMVNHSGGIDGFSSIVSFMPRKKIGVVVLTNMHRTMLTYVVTYNVFDRLLGLPQVDRSQKYINTVAEIIKEISVAEKDGGSMKKNTRPTHPLEDYAGKFSNPAYGEIIIEKEDNGLFIIFKNRRVQLTHYQYNTFKSLFLAPGGNLNMKTTFIIDDEGAIGSIATPLEPGVNDIVFKKISH